LNYILQKINKVDTISKVLILGSIKPSACFKITSKSIKRVGDSILITNCSNNAVRIKWSFGDGLFSTQTEVSHKFQHAGIYKIELTAYSIFDSDSDKFECPIKIFDSICSIGNYDTTSFYYSNDSIIVNCSCGSDTQKIDINNDGAYDIFYIQWNESFPNGGHGGAYFTSCNNDFYFALNTDLEYLRACNLNEIVNKLNNWKNYGTLYYSERQKMGQTYFYGFSSGYIGLMCKLNGRTLFGWIEITESRKLISVLQKN
jgi:hypothetical protein